MLSPLEINKAAEVIKFNGEAYDPVNMNCQIWVKALWKALTGEILDFRDLASSSFGNVVNYICSLENVS